MDDCFTGQSPGNAISIPAAPGARMAGPNPSLNSLGAGWETAGRRVGKGRF